MVGHRQRAVERRLLRDVPEMLERLRSVKPGIDPVDVNRTAGRALEGHERLDERRLTGCIGAHQCGGGSNRDRERHARKGQRPATVPFGQAASFERCVVGRHRC